VERSVAAFGAAGRTVAAQRLIDCSALISQRRPQHTFGDMGRRTFIRERQQSKGDGKSHGATRLAMTMRVWRPPEDSVSSVYRVCSSVNRYSQGTFASLQAERSNPDISIASHRII
jgi:hypothetical protein